MNCPVLGRGPSNLPRGMLVGLMVWVTQGLLTIHAAPQMWVAYLYVPGSHWGLHSRRGKTNIKSGNYTMLLKLQHGIVEVSTKSPDNLNVVLVLFWRLKEGLLKEVSTDPGFEG